MVQKDAKWLYSTGVREDATIANYNMIHKAACPRECLALPIHLHRISPILSCYYSLFVTFIKQNKLAAPSCLVIILTPVPTTRDVAGPYR